MEIQYKFIQKNTLVPKNTDILKDRKSQPRMILQLKLKAVKVVKAEKVEKVEKVEMVKK